MRRLKQVDFRASKHLTLHKFELGDLAFRLTVRPWQGDGGTHGCNVFHDPANEKGNEAIATPVDPLIQVGHTLAPIVSVFAIAIVHDFGVRSLLNPPKGGTKRLAISRCRRKSVAAQIWSPAKSASMI